MKGAQFEGDDGTRRSCGRGSDFHTTRIDTGRKTRSLVRQLETLGHKVALTAAEAA